MEIVILIVSAILFWYLLNVFWLIVGFSKVSMFKETVSQTKTTFTIVVPFRNEKENLPQLLDSLEKLSYPRVLFEVILVDDGSEDGFSIYENTSNYSFSVSVLNSVRKTSSPKKDAILTAIAASQNDWIVTTDADCIVPPRWLTTIDAFIQFQRPKMIAMGVRIQNNHSFLEQFQQLDFLSLQGTTIGCFGNQQAFMCNGANFAYTKTFFNSLQGFDGNDSIASGDDVFLLQKGMQREPKAVRFLKSESCVVTTKAENSWKNLVQQRMRWASKTGNYEDFYSKQLAWSVFLINTSLILTLLFCLILNFSWLLLLYLFSVKFMIDFLLLYQTGFFFKLRPRNIFLSSVCYPFFTVFIVGKTWFGNYTWKGRIFNQ